VDQQTFYFYRQLLARPNARVRNHKNV